MAGTQGETDNDGDYEGMIRSALAQCNVSEAVYAATRGVRAVFATVGKKRFADSGLIGAVLAAELLHFSRALPGFKPDRPVGCSRPPRPKDLLAAFDAALAALEADR